LEFSADFEVIWEGNVESGEDLKHFFLFALLFFVPLSMAREETKIHFDVGGGSIDVTVDRDEPELPQADLSKWLRDAAESVTAYYGRFPVPHLVVRITPFDGTGVRNGRTFATGGGLILMRVGNQDIANELASDWTLTHEMVHLAFPSVPDEHHWIEEGIAVYVEPIARIQAGHMDAATMWRDLVRDMPQGLPKAGDQGLDNTHTWGRTYWGGAIFCFLADIQIRRETNNAKGLQDALRGILDAGGDIRRDWELEKALQIGDRATGTHVLTNLYMQMRDKPVETNLDALWKQLGVSVANGLVHFQENAEMSSIRRSIIATVPAPAR
jgi:hypothetical protein